MKLTIFSRDQTFI